ncbi:DNA polymerase delta subunit 3 [Prunus avium]|uniref:DNA polymerase delta subunit 3 n=1 Tax=Prunus avium TaxID=42229 RepID=A0A6P5SMR9_PRUAV|nr:DNA polymerase delta subunit 3 [Prunus avium]
MTQIETLGIIQDIETLVSDQLQVVSYKWLSRNYLVSSNAAKRLLHEFVEKHGNGLEVVYVLAGWLKSNPLSYHIRLVSGPKLAEAKEEFEGNCSVEVYSVQACIPKDPAALWNAEFVQAEELFKQAPSVENCLRDNRFCGISNSFVKRNVEGAPLSIEAPQLKTKAVVGPSESSLAHQNIAFPKHVQNKGQQSSPKVGLQAPNVVKDVKSESNGTGAFDQANKPPAVKDKVPPVPANKKKVQNDKSSSASGGSLANLWGRASVKPKSNTLSENNNSIPNDTGASADAQVCAQEAVASVSSDDDGHEVNFKRASNGEGTRKRRVVFDFSDDDEDEDAVNLASPDNPKAQSCQDLKESSKVLVPEGTSLNFDEQVEDKPKVEDKPMVKEEVSVDRKSNQSFREDSSVSGISKGINAGIILKEKTHSCIPEKDLNKMDKPNNAASSSPKRRKVLKTVIDERGREVTEVIWEGEETEAKKADTSITKKADKTVASAVNRPPAAKKSVVNTAPTNGKAGSKKGGNKDPKQGNILSFFKKA